MPATIFSTCTSIRLRDRTNIDRPETGQQDCTGLNVAKSNAY